MKLCLMFLIRHHGYQILGLTYKAFHVYKSSDASRVNLCVDSFFSKLILDLDELWA